jgi:hypothetical protein
LSDRYVGNIGCLTTNQFSYILSKGENTVLRNSFRPSFRFVYALLIAFIVMTGMVGPAHAQATPPADFSKVNLFMDNGRHSTGLFNAADDFVIECPNEGYDLKDPLHPCNQGSASIISPFDDLVLVCPIAKDLGSNHPCDSRRAQIKQARPSDLVLVCPVEEVLEKHPCAETQASMAQFEIPDDYVMTCPTKPVLDPNHPCSRRSQ